MSLLTTIWSMIAGACGVLCFMHLLLWWRDRRQHYFLLSAVMAAASGASALVEMRVMQTTTIPEYAALLRVGNVVIGTMLVAMVWFVRGYLGTGRRWLAGVITALWSTGLVANAFSPASLTFARIDGLDRRTTFWGEDFFLAVGSAHPAKFLSDLASLLIMIYVIDATWRAWRRGARRSALIVGGSIAFFIVAAGIHTPLVDAGVVATPYMISIAFLAIVLALSYQIADDAARMIRLAREVRAGEQRWRTLIAEVQLAVIEVDPAGRVRDVNPFFETLTARAAATVRGRPASSLVAPDEAADPAERFPQATLNDPPPHSRWTVTAGDGDRRTLDWSSVRLLDANGAFDGVLSIGADVTDELAARRDLEHTRGRLDRVVRAGMLGELVSALSHELNQPLTAILSNAQTARLYLNHEHPPLDEVQTILERIIRDENRAAAVIERLRGLLARGEVVREDLDLAAVIDDVAALVRSQADHQGVTLDIDAVADLPPVVAGRVEIQQVILNLLLNALRALEDATGDDRRISVTTRGTDGGAMLTVRDTGPGVAAEQLEHLFEPFQGDRDGHIGMGLTICRRIVEAYGGTIEAANDPDGGAIFTVVLPVAIDARRAEHG